jgi:hypothetical protein
LIWIFINLEVVSQKITNTIHPIEIMEMVAEEEDGGIISSKDGQ